MAYRTFYELERALAPPPAPEWRPPKSGSHPYRIAELDFYNPSAEALQANLRVVERFDERPNRIRTATWFVPWFHHVYFGGIHTIFRFIQWMRATRTVEPRIVLYDVDIADSGVRFAIAQAFPDLVDIDIVVPPNGKTNFVDYSELPPTDVAVCTIWYSAYALLPFNQTKAKFYFVQDYEPAFYPGGSLWAQAEATYRFGYAGLVSTPGLAESYQVYRNPTCSFIPAVEPCRSRRPPSPPRPVRIVLYGRPSTDRNGFELLAAASRRVKQRYGDTVRIISVGEDFDPADYELDEVLEGASLLRDLDSLRDLYLRSDIGVCCMFSKHPSYQPLEYMASGVAVVTNKNPATTWLLRHEENCLLSDPFSTALAEAIGRLVEDAELRDQLTAAGEKTVTGRNWDGEFAKLWEFMTNTTVLGGHASK